MGFDLLRRGNTVLDSGTLRVWARSEASLTGSETVILRALLADPGTVCRRPLHDLLCLGRASGGPDTKTIDIVVMRLRRKLRAIGSDLTISAVRGVGFHVGGSSAERLAMVPLALLERTRECVGAESDIYADLTAAIRASGAWEPVHTRLGAFG